MSETKLTEERKKLWVDLYLLAHRNVIYLEPCEEKAIQLIADSEARAVEVATASAQAKSDVLTDCLSQAVEDRDSLNAALTAERNKVRVLTEALECYKNCVIAGGTNPARTALAATKETI